MPAIMPVSPGCHAFRRYSLTAAQFRDDVLRRSASADRHSGCAVPHSHAMVTGTTHHLGSCIRTVTTNRLKSPLLHEQTARGIAGSTRRATWGG